MPIRDAMQSAAVRLVGRRPSGFFTSPETFELELCDLVTDVAVAIMRAHDWQRLTKLHTITGDGATIAWPLPDDYDRLRLWGDVHSGEWTWRYQPVDDLDRWIDIQSSEATLSPGWWTILGGQFQSFPAIPTGEEAKFYYVSNWIADTKAAFSSDDDEFLLDNRLLTLGLIWRWRAQKRMEYAEDLQSYEIALSELAAKEAGQRAIIRSGSRRPLSAGIAYPWELG